MQTILTGIRVNSEPTLGNYLGVMLPMVRLANRYSSGEDPATINIFVPDLHSIISEVDGDLKDNTIRSIKYYLASGLKINNQIHIYRSSHVPAHAELCWILNCIATMGETSRMIQYKEKSKGKESCNVGIFDYPILMAADILLYDAEYVPIGEDQFQHIELTRNLAERFNHKFGPVFTIPHATRKQVEFMGFDEGLRIRNLVNPEKKMSKSSPVEKSRIMMSDSPKAAAGKIRSATTDSVGKIQFDMWNQPGISNLLIIEALVTGLPLQDVIATWAGETNYGDLKTKVAESVAGMLEEFQQKMAQIPDQTVIDLLETGEEYANRKANQKLWAAQEAIGLR